MSKSKRRSAASKADWRKSRGLHPDLHLNRHPAGLWCKKVRGKLECFDRIDTDTKEQAALLELEPVKSRYSQAKSGSKRPLIASSCAEDPVNVARFTGEQVHWRG